jgi:hypothetical protein
MPAMLLVYILQNKKEATVANFYLPNITDIMHIL